MPTAFIGTGSNSMFPRCSCVPTLKLSYCSSTCNSVQAVEPTESGRMSGHRGNVELSRVPIVTVDSCLGVMSSCQRWGVGTMAAHPGQLAGVDFGPYDPFASFHFSFSLNSIQFLFISLFVFNIWRHVSLVAKSGGRRTENHAKASGRFCKLFFFSSFSLNSRSLPFAPCCINSRERLPGVCNGGTHKKERERERESMNMKCTDKIIARSHSCVPSSHGIGRYAGCVSYPRWRHPGSMPPPRLHAFSIPLRDLFNGHQILRFGGKFKIPLHQPKESS